jgi:hypothetical protein
MYVADPYYRLECGLSHPLLRVGIWSRPSLLPAGVVSPIPTPCRNVCRAVYYLLECGLFHPYSLKNCGTAHPYYMLECGLVHP